MEWNVRGEFMTDKEGFVEYYKGQFAKYRTGEVLVTDDEFFADDNIYQMGIGEGRLLLSLEDIAYDIDEELVYISLGY